MPEQYEHPLAKYMREAVKIFKDAINQEQEQEKPKLHLVREEPESVCPECLGLTPDRCRTCGGGSGTAS
jgi:hypothetical protein